MQSLHSLHGQCVSGALEIRGVHLRPTLQALQCNYCTHVHRDGDAQTIYRAALVGGKQHEHGEQNRQLSK